MEASFFPSVTVLEGAVESAGGGGHQQSHPAVIPVSYNNDWYGKIRPWVLYWQKCNGGNEPFSG